MLFKIYHNKDLLAEIALTPDHGVGDLFNEIKEDLGLYQGEYSLHWGNIPLDKSSLKLISYNFPDYVILDIKMHYTLGRLWRMLRESGKQRKYYPINDV